jgi:outer membrane receptor protein involved in Fe transport
MKSILVFFLLFVPNFFMAQVNNVQTTKGAISGNIIDEKGNAINAATIKVVELNDTFHLMQITNQNGSFYFSKLNYGCYRVEIECLNFSKKIIDSILIRNEKPEIVFTDVIIHANANSLSEVIVYAEKPLIENKDDKIVYNMSESPLSSGASTAEMMKNMPLISVDADGTIKLAGKVPLILMDEKPVNVGGQQLQDLLESLPANVVEKVEIMQNPPPEYATYDGGVINIVTKKGRVGINKKISAYAGTRGEFGTTGSYSYRNSKLSINSYIGYNVAQTISTSNSKRENFYKDSVNYFYTDALSTTINHRPSFRFQTDYDFNKRNSISIVYQANLNYFNTSSNVLYQNLDSNLFMYKASTRTNVYTGNGYGQGFSASYLWKGINSIEKLQMLFSFNGGKNDNERDFYQQYLVNNFIPTGLDSTQNQFANNFSSVLFFKTDYNKPLNDTGLITLTTGMSISRNNYHNILNTNYLRKIDSSFINNILLSNDFYFTQTIFTYRAGLIFNLPFKLRIVAAQTEFTQTEFKFIKGFADNTNNSYWKLLPNLSIRKQFNKQWSAGVYFRESIRRPSIVELNPSKDFSDPYNIRYGNPTIAPALTNNYDINIAFNEKKFNAGIAAGYGFIQDVFSSIRTLIDSGKTETTYQNISNQQEYHASFWSGISINKMRFNASGGWNYNQYSEKQKSIYHYVDGGGYYAALNFSFAPDNITNFEANTRYSSFASAQGKTRSNVNMSLGVQRKFFKKQLIVAFNAIDPFGLLSYSGYTYASNFIIESYSTTNTRNFKLTLSYQINKTKLKSNLNEKDKKQTLDKLQAKYLKY